MRGQAAFAVILIIAIIAVVGYLLYSSGGFPGQSIGTVTYSNNVLSLDDKTVTSRTTFPGDTIGIGFNLQNNGDREISDIRVSFNLPAYVESSTIKCGFVADSLKGSFCDIRSIESLDQQPVSLDMKLVGDIGTSSSISIPVTYSVRYNYDGENFIRIPVVDDPDLVPSGLSYTIGTPTYGPVQVTIDPPVGREREVAGTRVVENFAFQDKPVSFKFRFSDVTSSRSLVKLTREGLKITLDGLQLIPGGCDRLDDSLNLKNDEEELPLSISCSMRAVPSADGGVRFGEIHVSYAYEYTISGTENFVVTPTN